MRTAIPLMAAALLILVGIALAFTLTGSPRHQRELAFDSKRVELLQEMRSAIDRRYEGVHKLPLRLPRDLEKSDPETGKPFEYIRTGLLTYKVCATFTEASDDTYYPSWSHGKGHRCFGPSAI